MRQKDIYLVCLDTTKWSEQWWTRPVVIISWNTMNENLPIVIVCPISSKLKKYYWSIFLEKNKINKLENDSEIISFQVRTVSKLRLVNKIWVITDKDLENVIEGLNDVLTY